MAGRQQALSRPEARADAAAVAAVQVQVPEDQAALSKPSLPGRGQAVLRAGYGAHRVAPSGQPLGGILPAAGQPRAGLQPLSGRPPEDGVALAFGSFRCPGAEQSSAAPGTHLNSKETVQR
ncbi:hypothetical protein ABZV29_40490 [Streptomyces sp. NPDC005236]|uniref:hypothetical protein n=1 Tax=Streptomyces sp. NPDC005236 TaxID=3157028 RepID=UPI0033A7B5EE